MPSEIVERLRKLFILPKLLDSPPFYQESPRKIHQNSNGQAACFGVHAG